MALLSRLRRRSDDSAEPESESEDTAEHTVEPLPGTPAVAAVPEQPRRRRVAPPVSELRRERRALMRVREERLRDLGGLALEMYRRDRFREDLLIERCTDLIALANGTRYGLQAGIFTSNVKTALEAARRLEFGGVTVNEAPTFRADQMPYGGVKDSGNTREGPAYAVRELTEDRLVVIDL